MTYCQALAKQYEEQQRPTQQSPLILEKKNNFPPFPSRCPCQPCFYHKISEEIPPHNQSLIRQVWLLWWLLVVTWCLNEIAYIAAFAVDTDSGEGFGFSLLWFVLAIPFSFLCWYWPLYKAFKNDSSMWFMWFFFVFFFQIIAFIVYLIGIPKSGYMGFILAFKTVSDNTAAGIICILVSVFWSVCAIIGAVLMIKIHRYYRTSGMSVQKAQQEFAESRAARSAASAVVETSVAAATAK
jgi:signal transduction histidine kinase